eukprot:GHVQ01004584.1.p1 GENE.GHVQ01004584.1~~GHVQ01004584.1.p1  ORF type:complete len:441 (-),score=61.95 GHVQ01004584.1:711-2033(-)
MPQVIDVHTLHLYRMRMRHFFLHASPSVRTRVSLDNTGSRFAVMPCGLNPDGADKEITDRNTFMLDELQNKSMKKRKVCAGVGRGGSGSYKKTVAKRHLDEPESNPQIAGLMENREETAEGEEEYFEAEEAEEADQGGFMTMDLDEAMQDICQVAPSPAVAPSPLSSYECSGATDLFGMIYSTSQPMYQTCNNGAVPVSGTYELDTATPPNSTQSVDPCAESQYHLGQVPTHPGNVHQSCSPRYLKTSPLPGVPPHCLYPSTETEMLGINQQYDNAPFIASSGENRSPNVPIPPLLDDDLRDTARAHSPTLYLARSASQNPFSPPPPPNANSLAEQLAEYHSFRGPDVIPVARLPQSKKRKQKKSTRQETQGKRCDAAVNPDQTGFPSQNYSSILDQVALPRVSSPPAFSFIQRALLSDEGLPCFDRVKTDPASCTSVRM